MIAFGARITDANLFWNRKVFQKNSDIAEQRPLFWMRPLSPILHLENSLSGHANARKASAFIL
jgi:hypothetical protein